MASELAVVQRENVSSGERRWTLRSATDEPGWLSARVPEGEVLPPWDDAVVYECRIGRFGSSAREAAFIESIRRWRPKHTR
jgi:hypothetical protein